MTKSKRLRIAADAASWRYMTAPIGKKQERLALAKDARTASLKAEMGKRK